MPFGRSVVRVANPDGLLLGQLFGSLESVTWRADGYGTAALLLSAAVATESAYLLEVGNRVRVDFDNGLPPWGGLVDLPAETAGGVTRVQLYEAGSLLGQTLTPRSVLYDADNQAAAGSIMWGLLKRSPVALEGRTPRSEGPVVSAAFVFETLLSAFAKLRDLDAHLHYYVQLLDSGGVNETGFEFITFHDDTPDTRPQAILREGHNFVGTRDVVQGPLVNVLIVATGDAVLDGRIELPEPERTTTSPYGGYEVSRLNNAGEGDVLILSCTPSIRRYGRREALIVLSDVIGAKQPGRAVEFARAYLDIHARPTRRINGVALNLSPGRWDNIRIGRRVTVERQKADEEWRRQELLVLGMDFSPAEGTLRLVFAEPTEEL